MSVYNINFFNKVIEWLPVDKRGYVQVRFLQSLIAPLYYQKGRVLDDYRLGSSYPQWIPSTYAVGQKVVYKQVVYECISAGATSTPPSSEWRVYLDSFIGTDERVLFNGQKLVLEYALNDYYQTAFRQPPLVSDIYINNTPYNIVGFVVGKTAPYSSNVAQTDISGKTDYNSFTTYSIGNEVKYNGYLYISLQNSNVGNTPAFNTDSFWLKVETINWLTPFQQLNNFNINVPSAVYYSSVPYTPNIEKEMRGIVDKLIPAGLKYTITPY